MPSGDSYEPFINFDPRFCRRIARVAAAACAVLVLCTVIILLTIDPSNTRCPGWRLVAKNGTSTSVWGFVVIQAVMAIWMLDPPVSDRKQVRLSANSSAFFAS